MSTTTSCINCTDGDITSECTVNAAIAKSPRAASVFNGFGIDTCCGGRASIGEAAVQAHVSTDVLLEALRSTDVVAVSNVKPASGGSCSCGCDR